MLEILNDESYMRLAIQMAAQAQGQTGVNPVVGCIVVKDGRVIGMGAHLREGTPHAEVHALNMAGAEAEGSTVYVTLEPCSHFGKTPPCSDRLITERVKKVFVACKDPNALVAGAGINKLKEHGIEVEVGLLEQEAIQLNEKFNKYIVTKLPFVTLKTASTLDGKIATYTGDSKWITNEASRSYVHTLRHQHQAIMVGVETVIHDNPKLTTRLTVEGLHPIRVVVDSMLRTPLDAKLIQDLTEKHLRTIVLTTEQASQQKQSELESLGAEIIRCGSGERVDLAFAMQQLGARGISSILLEGGGRLNGAMLKAQLIDKIILFIAPKIIGGAGAAPSSFDFPGYALMKDAVQLSQMNVKSFGNDICIIGTPEYGGEPS